MQNAVDGEQRVHTYDDAITMLSERLGRDTLLSVATMDGDRPSVRIVDGYYEDGSFYSVTYALSNKMRQIAVNPEVAVCGEVLAGHGVGENLGHPHDERNVALMVTLRDAFSQWYDNGHTDESDPHTCILRVRLTDAVVNADETRYQVDFVNRTVSAI